jgi:hypothetical protein
MLKLIAGNIAFGLIVWGWYVASGGETAAFRSGVVAIFLAFVVGTGFGVWLAQKPHAKAATPAKPSTAIDDGVFDRIS